MHTMLSGAGELQLSSKVRNCWLLAFLIAARADWSHTALESLHSPSMRLRRRLNCMSPSPGGLNPIVVQWRLTAGERMQNGKGCKMARMAIKLAGPYANSITDL